MAVKYYAVRKGKIPGVYDTWEECKAQVDGYSGAEYKSFASIKEAETYIGGTAAAENEYPKNVLVAYVDGSYEETIKKYSYGVVLIYNGEIVKTISKIGHSEEAASMRNVAGELGGACAAIKYALDNKHNKLVIYHDYEGIGRWANGEWKANNIHTRKYAEFVCSARKKCDISFAKVKGHSGNKYNDMADELAKSALCGFKVDNTDIV